MFKQPKQNIHGILLLSLGIRFGIKKVSVIAQNKKNTSAPNMLKQLDRKLFFCGFCSKILSAVLTVPVRLCRREAHLNPKVQQRAYDSLRDMCQMQSAPINKGW